MKVRELLLNATMVGLIAGCGHTFRNVSSPNNPNIGPVDRKSLKADVVGYWTGPCKQNDDTSTQQVLYFSSDNKYSSDARTYGNSNCQGNKYKLSSGAKFESKYSLISSPSYASGQVQIVGDQETLFVSGKKMKMQATDGTVTVYSRTKSE